MMVAGWLCGGSLMVEWSFGGMFIDVVVVLWGTGRFVVGTLLGILYTISYDGFETIVRYT